MGESSLIGYPVTLFGGRHISIGDNVYLGIRGTLTSWYSYNGDIFNPSISIGDNTSIGDEYHITAINQIHIGCNVLMGKKITITDNSHGEIDFDSLLLSPIDRHLISKGAVIIEDNVWIGDKVTILPNIRIGKNAIIGANSVVTKDIPENSVAAGIPAGVIKILR
jgi:acetyltransferase-like isoleucine patch superfamily enzyme